MARQDIGIPDEIYDIVSVLYHALQGAETYDQYIQKIQINWLSMSLRFGLPRCVVEVIWRR